VIKNAGAKNVSPLQQISRNHTMFTPHNRRSIRLKDYDYSQSGLYFITICTRDRECLFGDIDNNGIMLSKEGLIAEKYWNAIPAHFPNTILREHIIMPNHIHGIIEITDMPNDMENKDIEVENIRTENVGAKHFSPLQQISRKTQNGTARTIGSIVRGFKIGVTKELGFSPWQRNYYERIIRDCNEYKNAAEYIEQNPYKWETDRFYINK
jgi:REP element-mobilizing transposase RayT